MGGKKGIPHRYHSKEFKLRAVQMVLSGKSAVEVGKELSVRGSLVCTWVRQYQEGGEPALEPKRKPGNPLTHFSYKTRNYAFVCFLDLFNNEILEWNVHTDESMDLIIPPLRRLLKKTDEHRTPNALAQRPGISILICRLLRPA